MAGNKVLTIILGVILSIGGIWCISTPVSTSLALVWIFGVFMFVKAIGDLSTYSARKAMGYADGFSLAMSIISLIFGIMLIFSWTMKVVTAEIMLYFICFWLIVGGVMSIVGSVQAKRFLGINPLWGIVVGVLMIIAGFIGIAHPILGALSIGIIVGVNILVCGVNLIAQGIFTSKAE